VVWFLKTTKDPRYTQCLKRYFDALKGEVTRWLAEQKAAVEKDGKKWVPPKVFPAEVNNAAMAKALEAGFKGVDLGQLEKDWIASEPY
jgi:hypothetical protein